MSHPLYCDDCGREKMAELRDGKLVITDRRHGRRHVAVIPLSELRSLLDASPPYPIHRGRGRQVPL